MLQRVCKTERVQNFATQYTKILTPLSSRANFAMLDLTYILGRCYNNGDCPKDYICGHNNCGDFSSDANPLDDCCVPGTSFFNDLLS